MSFIGAIFLLLQTYLSFFKPKWFLFLYLLFTSSFLGFFPKVILLGDKDIALFYQTSLIFFSFLIFYKQTKTLPIIFRYLLKVTLAYYIYGLLYPIINGTSSFSLSIIASKQFSCIFLIHYLFIHRKVITKEWIYKILFFFGYYFLIFLMIYAIFKIAPPYYIKEGQDIQYFYPTILSLFLFIKSYQSHSIRQKTFTLFLLLIWGIGMKYDGHMAITITTLLSCLIIVFKTPIIHLLQNYKRLLMGLVFFVILLFLLPTNKYINLFKQDQAIIGRERINKERYELINNKPLIGYGFLHRGAFELTEVNSKYSKELSFIDSGYTDLLGKFGILGTSFYLLFFLNMFFYKSSKDDEIKIYKLYFFQFLVVNITWSVFSFNLGLTPLALVIILFYLSSYKQKHNESYKS